MVAVVNVGQIDQAFEAGEEVTLESLAEKNLAKGRFDILKILGDGELSKKLKISAHRFSKSAVEKIKKDDKVKELLIKKEKIKNDLIQALREEEDKKNELENQLENIEKEENSLINFFNENPEYFEEDSILIY